MSYNYNELISKSMIYGKYFNAIKSPTEIEANFIPCNHIKKFTIDTLLYLHIYTGLYLSIMEYNKTNSDKIEKLDELVKGLKIKIDTSTFTYNASTNVITAGNATVGGSSTSASYTASSAATAVTFSGTSTATGTLNLGNNVASYVRYLKFSLK